MHHRALALIALAGCVASSDEPEFRALAGAGELDLLDDSGAPLGERPIEVGEDLGLTLRGLARDTDHTISVRDDAGTVFTLTSPSDATGALDRLLLWPDLGLGDDRESAWFATRDLATAQDRLGGRRLRVVVEAGGRAVAERSLVVAPERVKPRVLAVDERGAILRRTTAETRTARVLASHLAPGAAIEVLMLPERAEWRDGDLVVPATSRVGRPLVWRSVADDRGELAISVDARDLPPGAFQLATHPPVKPGTVLRVDARWLFAKRLAPALVVPAAPYWTGAAIRFADISTRATAAAPFFTREDVFFTGEPVWATLDAAGGHATPARKVRFYVVPHRTPAEWRANAPLVDVSGHVVEAAVTLGGTTATRGLIGSALTPGRYDLVIDTGNQPLNPGAFQSDDRFDAAGDLVDGVTRVGFTILDDPNATGPYAVGSTRYQAADVTYAQDPPRQPITTRVMAEVRYPANTAGEGTVAALGTFPVVVFAHGNALPSNGHELLLAHLASHGYITVAIEVTDLQPSGHPIEHKAQLLIDHLGLLSDPGRQPMVLQGHVDATTIALAGHSQGGDAALRAAYIVKRDGLALHPRAVMAIAPTDGSVFSPDPSVIELPYLGLAGSQDNDVGRAGGHPFASPTHGGLAFRAYDRNAGPKAMVFIERACHTLFNEQYPSCELVGATATPLSHAVHQQLVRGYLTAFLALHVRGDDLQRVLFETGSLRDTATVVHHQLHDASARVLDNFEDGVATTNTAAGINTAGGFTAVADDAIWLLDPSAPHSSYGRLLRWQAPGAAHRLRVPQAIDASGDLVLSLRVAQAVGFLDLYVGLAADTTALDAGQLGSSLAAWISAHGSVAPNAYVVVETPGLRWRIQNGAQRLIVISDSTLATPGVTSWFAIRNADIAETHAPMPIWLRVTDATGRSRSIQAVVAAPVVPPPAFHNAAFGVERSTLAALETIRIPIAAFAIPDASGPGIDPTQVAEVAIELDAPRGELLVDDIEIAP